MIKLRSGERIMLSVAQDGIVIYRMRLAGLLAGPKLAHWQPQDLSQYVALFGGQSGTGSPFKYAVDRLAQFGSIQELLSFLMEPRKVHGKAPEKHAEVDESVAGTNPIGRFTGGDGSSAAQAVKINVSSSRLGTPAQYVWLELEFGKRGTDWDVEMRGHGKQADGRVLSTFNIRLANGTHKTVVFDISSFYGRFG